MSVLGINNGLGGLSTYSNITNNVQNTYKTEQLEKALTVTNSEETTDEELMDVCKNFEAYFVEQVFKEMKKTVNSEEEENEYSSYFGEMLTQTYAENATEGQGLGIAQLLYDSMKRNGI